MPVFGRRRERGKSFVKNRSFRHSDASQRELAQLAFLTDDSLLDLLCEDGLLSPREAREEHSPAQLLALLRRIFGRETLCVKRPAETAHPLTAFSDAPPSLRAPPAAA